MLEAMRPGDPSDPIARQFVPSPEELSVQDAELGDPIGDAAHSPVGGIVHRYADRVLLKPIHVCPFYCRFCFRREVVGPGSDMLSDRSEEHTSELQSLMRTSYAHLCFKTTNQH